MSIKRKKKKEALSGILMVAALTASTVALLSEIVVSNDEVKIGKLSRAGEFIMFAALGASAAAAATKFLDNSERQRSNKDLDD